MSKPHLILKYYLDRWHLIPKNRWFNIYLHKFTGSDIDRALHDHPWWSISVNFSGELKEIRETGWQIHNPFKYLKTVRYIWKFIPYFRRATDMHRMILKSDTAWTLFITGPKRRPWGFRVVGEPNDWIQKDAFFEKYMS